MVRIVKKPEERRQEIVTASRSLFLAQGYERTTMQDVMLKLRIAKGTTYHYFKSKEDLLNAVVEDIVTEYISMVEKALHACTGNALEKMRVLVTVGNIASASSNTIDALHHPDNRGLHARLLVVTLMKLAPLYARVIAQGCEEEVFHVEHPLECAEILLAGVQFVTDLGFYPWSQEDLQRRMRAIPSLLEHQLNAPKGVFSALFTWHHKGN